MPIKMYMLKAVVRAPTSQVEGPGSNPCRVIPETLKLGTVAFSLCARHNSLEQSNNQDCRSRELGAGATAHFQCKGLFIKRSKVPYKMTKL